MNIISQNDDGTVNILVPNPDTVYDDQGNPLTTFLIQVVNPGDLNRQNEAIQSQIDMLTDQLTTIQNTQTAVATFVQQVTPVQPGKPVISVAS